VGSSKYAYFSSYDFDQFFPVGRTPTLVVMILINSFRSGLVTGELHCKIPICIARSAVYFQNRTSGSIHTPLNISYQEDSILMHSFLITNYELSYIDCISTLYIHSGVVAKLRSTPKIHPGVVAKLRSYQEDFKTRWVV
jgi:hypothetical protein